MKTILTLRVILLGLASWVVPFILAFAFYDRTGQLAIDVFLFKSIMVVFGGLVGAYLLLRAFRRVTPSFANGLALGLVWLVLNWALDIAILVGAMGMPASEWFQAIGLRYLMIPIMATAMGTLAARQAN